MTAPRETAYSRRVAELVAEGLTNGDAQAIADHEDLDDSVALPPAAPRRSVDLVLELAAGEIDPDPRDGLRGRRLDDDTRRKLAAELDQARADVEALVEAAQYRVDWTNGTWYLLTHDGAAVSNRGHATEALALAEGAAELAAAVARVGGVPADDAGGHPDGDWLPAPGGGYVREADADFWPGGGQ